MSVESDITKLLVDDKKSFGFEVVQDTEALEDAEQNNQRYLIKLDSSRLKVMFYEYIELHEFGGLLLIEPVTKVFALVLLEPALCEGQKSGDTPDDWFATQLSKVNMLQHILRHKANKQYSHYTVEVLFVVKEHLIVEQQLNKLVSKSQLIHLISVNYLVLSGTKGIEEVSLKKAMPWLLLNYRQWFENRKKQTKASSESTTKTGQLTQITTDNYRLPGRRKVKFHDKANIHLFHGHNGSGKSTLVETIELLNTNKIKRFGSRQPTEYSSFISNKGSESAVHFEWMTLLKTSSTSKDGKEEVETKFEAPNKTITFSKNDCSEKVVGDINADSFILNQKFIEGLINDDTRARYALFYNAFFNQDRDDYEFYHRLRDQVEQYRIILAKRLECGEDEQSLFDEVKSTLRSQPRKSQLLRLLPISIDKLKSLVKISPALSPLIKSLEAEKKRDKFKTTLQNLNQPFADLCGQRNLLADLIKGNTILTQYQNWFLVNDGSRESFAQLFDQWSVGQAKADLLAKRIQLANISATDVLVSQEMKEIGISGKLQLNRHDQDRMPRFLSYLKQQNNQLKLDLELKFSDLNEKAQADIITDIVRLTYQQIDLFNRIGEYLTDVSGASLQGLGFTLATAINNQQSNTQVIDLGLNQKGWVAPLQAQLKPLIEAVGALQQAEKAWAKSLLLMHTDIHFSASAWMELCEWAKTQLSDFDKTLKHYQQNFLTQLSKDNNSLFNTLNELLYLFTPARWLYQPLELISDPINQVLHLRVEGHEGDASLIWNTAELNLVAVTLFLLCANYHSNERLVNTIVMDDPLQNMDELTSTYFARGLAKLHYCWEEGKINSQLIMLFHGEQAIEQFSQIVPAAVYHLPWREAPDPIKYDPKKSLIGQRNIPSLTSLLTFSQVK